jgi:hypothetical protein
MPFSKEEQDAIWHAIDRAGDDLAHWDPADEEEQESWDAASAAVELADAAMSREYPR